MTTDAPTQTHDESARLHDDSGDGPAAPGSGVRRAAAVPLAVGIVIELIAAARIGSFDTAYLIGGEVLLTGIGIAVGSGWRHRRRAGQWWSGRLSALWLLLVFTALYVVFMATAAEVGDTRASVVSSMALVTNWWLVFGSQLPIVAPSPLQALWLPVVAVQIAVVGSLVRVLVRRSSWTPRRWPRGAVVAGVAGLAATVWTIVLANLAAASTPGASPLGDPATLPTQLVRLLNIDGTYDLSRIAYGTDTRAAGFLFGVCAAYLLPRFAARLEPSVRLLGLVGGVGALVLLAFAAPIGWLLNGGLGLAGALAAFMGLCAAGATGDDAIGRVVGPTAWLGERSWPIYVWLLPVAILAAESRSGLAGPAAIGVGLVVPLVVGIGLDRFASPWLRRITSRSGRVVRTRVIVSYGLAVVVFGATFFNIGPGLYVYHGADEDGRYPVLFAGDSMPFGLNLVVTGRELDTDVGVAGRLAALPGCGITTGALINRDVVTPRAEECDALLGYMNTETVGSDPSVAFLLAWAWELYDHQVDEDGGVVRYDVGTPEWRDRFGTVAQEAIDVLSQEGALVVLITMPCVDPDADTPNHPDSVAATEPERLEAVNDMVRQLADWNRSTTVLADLDGEYLCPDGNYRDHIDGVLMSDDSVHFTLDGAEKIWLEYLVPEVRALLGVPEGPIE